MAASGRYKLPRPVLDTWSTREKLALAFAVMRSGDQNWVSVSRAIRVFSEVERPEAWFSQKNCALQYSSLLEKVETPKRKRGEKERDSVGTAEAPGSMIGRKLTIERIEELKQLVQDSQNKYIKLKDDVDEIKAGKHDDKLADMVAQIQAKQSKKASPSTSSTSAGFSRADTMDIKQEFDTLATQDTVHLDDTIPPLPELSNEVLAAELDLDSSTLSLTDLLTKSPAEPPIDPARLDLTETLAAIKDEPIDIEGEEEIPMQLDSDSHPQVKVEPKVTDVEEVQDTGSETATPAPTVHKSPATAVVAMDTELAATQDAANRMEIAATQEQDTYQLGSQTNGDGILKIFLDSLVEEKEDEETASESKTSTAAASRPNTPKEKQTSARVDEDKGELSLIEFPDTPVDCKDEPPSSPSSIISCDTDGGSSSRGKGRSSSSSSRRRGGGGCKRGTGDRRQRGSRQTPGSSRRSRNEEDSASKASEMDTSDDEDESKNEESDTASNAPIKNIFNESTPNSPASTCPLFANEEEEKAHKIWKKSIMLVWRAAANHKYANVFLHPVTEDIAPGYHSVVQRPKDLVTIKKNIENGVIRTTPEFQRDIMLMFTNAIMYNNSDHNVFNMATEMYDDVMNHIEQYVLTQLMVKDHVPKGRHRRADPATESLAIAPPPETGGKLLRGTRRSDVAASGSDKEDDRKRRMSIEPTDHSAGGKAKKRKP